MAWLDRSVDWGTRGAARNAEQVLARRARVHADLELQLQLIVRRAERAIARDEATQAATAAQKAGT